MEFKSFEATSVGEAPFGFHIVEVNQCRRISDQSCGWNNHLNYVCGFFEGLL